MKKSELKKVVSDADTCIEVLKKKKKEKVSPEKKPVIPQQKKERLTVIQKKINEIMQRGEDYGTAVSELIAEGKILPDVCEKLEERAIILDVTVKKDVKEMIDASQKGNCFFYFSCKKRNPECGCNIKRSKNWLTSSDHIPYNK